MKASVMERVVSRVTAGGKSGAILGMVLIMVVALSLVGLGLMNLGRANAVEVSRSYNLNKAFWAAEAGLFDARARLRGDASYRGGSFPSGFSSPSFGYTVGVTTSDHVDFTIVSTGVVQGATRIVRSELRVEEGWPSAFDYSFYSGETMKIAKDTSVTGDGVHGDVYANTGYAPGSKVPITNNAEIYDGVAGAYPEPTPVPPVPVFDTTYYDGLLATAAGSLNTTYPASLGGGTYYVKNAVIITTPISGPGILVVNGGVTIESATASVGDGIMIIAKDTLAIGNALSTSLATLGSNDVFYSATKIEVGKGNNFSAGHSVLMTPGNINIQKEVVFAGLIYAGGDIVLDKAPGTTATITGTVVAGGDLTLKKDFIVVYDPSQFDEILPGFNTEIVVKDGVWTEVFQ